MSKPISTNITHDAFLKSILSDRGAALAFMHTFLPVEVSTLLDIDAYNPGSISFITSKMKTRLADVVFEVPLKNSQENAFVTILIELKSSPDKYALFQILEYIAQAYRKQLKDKKKLQLIIPVIYYHGKPRWKYNDINAFFQHSPKALTKFIPTFSSLFIDLKDKNETELQEIKNDLLRVALNVQYLQFLKSIDVSILERTFTGIHEGMDWNHFKIILVYALRKSEINRDIFDDFIEDFPQDTKNKTMTIAEQLIQEGKKKGIEQGIEQGIQQKTIEFVVKSFESGISIPVITKISGLSQSEVRAILNKK